MFVYYRSIFTNSQICRLLKKTIFSFDWIIVPAFSLFFKNDKKYGHRVFGWFQKLSFLEKIMVAKYVKVTEIPMSIFFLILKIKTQFAFWVPRATDKKGDID